MTPIPAYSDQANTTPGTSGDLTRREWHAEDLPLWAALARDFVDRVFTQSDNPTFATRESVAGPRESDAPIDATMSGIRPSDLLETIRHSDEPQPAPTPSAPMRVKNRWTGVVDAVGDDVFEAHFVEIGNEAVEYQGDFLIGSLSEEDRRVLKVGMSFYAVRSDIQLLPGGHWQETTALRLGASDRSRTSRSTAPSNGCQWAALLRERAHIDDEA